MIRSTIFFLLLSVIVLFSNLVGKVSAAPYNVAYVAEYFPKNEADLTVNLSITLTNLRSDLYIKEFSLTLPPHFVIESPSTKLGNETIQTKLDNHKSGATITFTLPENTAPKNNSTILQLTFTQKNGIRHVGSVWEVILPAIKNKENATFAALLHVPPGVDRHVGVAKPVPSKVDGDVIHWDNVDTSVIYLTFGTSQRYQTNLTYTLKNPDLLTRKTTIALPPQTSFQKIYEGNIFPVPDRRFIDSDGNYLAEYTLSSKQELTVHYSGIVEVFNRPLKAMNLFIKNAYLEQKLYIFNETSYWTIEQGIVLPKDASNPTPKNIFDRVVNHLTYDSKQIEANGSRKGASLAIKRPDQAVCTEYTDLFVALARKEQIPAREVEGFAYSDDAGLRPKSFSGDILHSWPEYYDETQNLWIPIDPTWTDTSGIDYFNSFDLNHIVLAIHGKDPVYPLPAGMYKLRDRQDIDIKPIATVPKEINDVQVSLDIPQQAAPLTTQKGTLLINNNSNVSVTNSSFLIKNSHLTFKPRVLNIPLIAPHEVRSVPFEFSVSKGAGESRSTTLDVHLNGKKVASKSIIIRSTAQSLLNYGLGISIGAIFLGTIFYKVFKRT